MIVVRRRKMLLQIMSESNRFFCASGLQIRHFVPNIPYVPRDCRQHSICFEKPNGSKHGNKARLSLSTFIKKIVIKNRPSWKANTRTPRPILRTRQNLKINCYAPAATRKAACKARKSPVRAGCFAFSPIHPTPTSGMWFSSLSWPPWS